MFMVSVKNICFFCKASLSLSLIDITFDRIPHLHYEAKSNHFVRHENSGPQ